MYHKIPRIYLWEVQLGFCYKEKIEEAGKQTKKEIGENDINHFEEMKMLFKKIGLDMNVTKGAYGKMIDVRDNEGMKAEFSFHTDGSFKRAGYYDNEADE